VATIAVVDADPETAATDEETEMEAEQAPQPSSATSALLARIDSLTAAWGRLDAQLAEIRQRIGAIERRQVDASADEEASEPRARRPGTAEEQRDALLRAGVASDVADEILWRRAQTSLEQLELRDQAIREGWMNSDRYREELRRINAERVSMRDEIGADAYDRYLYETGRNNRVRVESLIPGSAGEASGLEPGDVIERYSDRSVLNVRDLRSATSEGERGELVPVMVRRGDERLEIWLPRGPIGIGLEATRLDPRS
jgi:hypothetical protein